MKIRIEDDFDLFKIANCGQCFRAKLSGDGTWRFVTGGELIYIKELTSDHYEVSFSSVKGDEVIYTEEDHSLWENVWIPYFDLERDYQGIRKKAADDPFLTAASDMGKGIRILKQDPFEMLITFIISQRKNIPAIKKSVEALCNDFGRSVKTPFESLSLFPAPGEIDVGERSLLSECSLGYRLPYVKDAIAQVVSGELDLNGLDSLSDEELFESLKQVKGVGDKVSNCICLFAYHRTGRAPVDVWIKRMIDEHYAGINPFPKYGNDGGIMQQFIFYYAQMTKDKKV